MVDRKELDPFEKEHKEMLYPAVRVRTEKAGGSGTIIYSREIPGKTEEFETYILTNHHVIEDAVQFKKRWDAIAKREKVAENRQTVQVEIFEYKYGSTIVGSSAFDADIVAWDKDHDLALLKLRTIKAFKYIAKLFPAGKEEEVKLFAPSYAVGCSLGHSPIPSTGMITGKNDEIDNKSFWMSSAQIIFGNSGGSMYLKESHEFIGVPARVSGYMAGFNMDVVTHMGLFIPITRVYEFLLEQYYQFIYDKKYSSKTCEDLRKKKQAIEEKKILLPEPEPLKEEEDK